MRNNTIDTFRGLLFIPMFIYHCFIFYDLKYKSSYSKLPNIDILGNVRILYIVLAGFMVYVHKQKYKEKSLEKKILNWKLIAGAIIMTLVSHYYWPRMGIKFGILHFMYIGSIILTMTNDMMIVLLSVVLFVMRFIPIKSTILGSNYIYPSIDWFPLIPNLPLLITGYHIGKIYKLIPYTKPNILTYIGKHSLEFYVGHMIILMLLSKN